MLNNMKTSLFYLLFFFISLFCHGQSSDIKIDYDYFLLGTLNDYIGRDNYKKIIDRIDRYSPQNKPLVYFLDSVFRDKYPDLVVNVIEKTGQLELWSKSLALKMNNFYCYEPSNRKIYIGEADIMTLNLDSLTKTPDFYTSYFDTIYTGRIKDDIFRNDAERLSFIAGAYMRFGGKKNSLYYISIPNSISKVGVVTEQLKELECSNIEYIMLKDHIPAGHIVYFTPTDKLKNYLELYTKHLRYNKFEQNNPVSSDL